MELYKIRSLLPSDINFIINSWLRSFRANSMFKLITNDQYYDQHQKLIKKLMIKSDVFLAVNKEDPDQIFGWICAEDGDIVHYVYVKEPYRNMGIARALMSQCLSSDNPSWFYTHYDKAINALRPGGNYNPYLAVYGE